MSRHRSLRNQAQIQEDQSSITDKSEMNTHLVFQTPGSVASDRPYSISQEMRLSDRFSHEEIFRLLLKDVDKMTKEFESLVAEHSYIVDNALISNNSANSSTHYVDTVTNKGNFISKLTNAVENTQINALDIPKYSNLGLIELLSRFKKRYKETKQNVTQDNDLLKKQQSETVEIFSQINIFSSLVEDLNDVNKDEQYAQARSMFQEAKTDLDLVLSFVFPKEADKNKFSHAMAALVEQYRQNLDSKEDQYVEIVPNILKSTKLLRTLVENHVVTIHPDDPKKLRLNIG